jgi:hypothetical protein
MIKVAQFLSTLICDALQIDGCADRQNKDKGVVFVRYVLTQRPGETGVLSFFPSILILSKNSGEDGVTRGSHIGNHFC